MVKRPTEFCDRFRTGGIRLSTVENLNRMVPTLPHSASHRPRSKRALWLRRETNNQVERSVKGRSTDQMENVQFVQLVPWNGSRYERVWNG